jgi:peptidoglycan/LPS O-acetylase OafA/YrhL
MTARSDFRHDIQFLRGVAVLLVVLFHAFDESGWHGFLGVDVFFVISGFLVTSMIVRELDSDSFSLGTFYFRRIKRIVPAAFSTLIVTTLVAYWILTSYEWDDYPRQLIACILFSANLLLSRRDGYFGPDPQTEPLRHFWSLAVEEQFYLVIPLVLMVLPRHWRLYFIAVVAAASLLLCAIGATVEPILVFYNLPTRAWELLAGALCSFAAGKARFTPSGWACWLALGAIIGVSLFGLDSVHPRGDAMIVVGATCLILFAREDWLPRNRLVVPIVKVGDWSYSLYLVHWPILSFVHLASGRQPTGFVLAGALALSLIVAWLQFRFVELPFWRRWPMRDRRRWAILAAMAASLVVLPLPAAVSVLAGAGRRQAAEIAPRNGLPGCASQANTGLLPDRCRTGTRPMVALWGDSFALHLVDGILADPALKDQLIQFTSRGCPPVLGFSPVWRGTDVVDPAKCIRYNDRALSALATGSERVVVISSPFGAVLGDDGRKVMRGGRLIRWTPALADGFTEGVKRLRAAGKQVVIVGPTPSDDTDMARCNVQVREGLLRLGSRNCRVHLDALTPTYVQAAAALSTITRQTGSWLLMPADALCSKASCLTKVGPKLVYRDKGHLTEFGSIYVVSHLGLNVLLRKLVSDPNAHPPTS